MLFPDILNKIFFYLSNRDYCRFFSTNKEMQSLMDQVDYPGLIFSNRFPEKGRVKKLVITKHPFEIPQSVKTLILRSSEKVSIRGIVPPWIEYLSIDGEYLFFDKNTIPPSVKKLCLRFSFNHSIRGCIPKTVKRLITAYPIKEKFSECIPGTIEDLEIQTTTKKLDKISEGIKILKLPNSFDSKLDLPTTLERIEFGDAFQRLENFSFHNLTHLKLGYSFNHPVDCLKNLPLRVLKFGSTFDQPIDCLKNCPLRVLKFGYWFDQPVECLKNLPLQVLKFGERFNKPIKGFLPNTLIKLKFGRYGNFFQQTLKDALPESLEILCLPYYFANENPKDLPENIQKVFLPKKFLGKVNFPKYCKVIFE